GTPRVLVDHKDGHLQVPHWLSDNLLPQLSPYGQLVYYRLYRLSHGFGRDECVIGTPTLERLTGIKHTALFATLKDLESKGLIDRLGQVVLGSKGGQGNRYRVHLPTIVDSTPNVRATRGDRGTPNVPGTRSVRMKENKENNKSAPAASAAANVF